MDDSLHPLPSVYLRLTDSSAPATHTSQFSLATPLWLVILLSSYIYPSLSHESRLSSLSSLGQLILTIRVCVVDLNTRQKN